MFPLTQLESKFASKLLTAGQMRRLVILTSQWLRTYLSMWIKRLSTVLILTSTLRTSKFNPIP
jgi:hypothetical protein